MNKEPLSNIGLIHPECADQRKAEWQKKNAGREIKLPLIPPSFVEAYVREQGKIEEVSVEEESILQPDSHVPITQRVKLRSDGTCIIHRLKETWTYAELKQACWKAYTAKMPAMTPEDITEKLIPEFEEWLKQHIKDKENTMASG